MTTSETRALIAEAQAMLDPNPYSIEQSPISSDAVIWKRDDTSTWNFEFVARKSQVEPEAWTLLLKGAGL